MREADIKGGVRVMLDGATYIIAVRDRVAQKFYSLVNINTGRLYCDHTRGGLFKHLFLNHYQIVPKSGTKVISIAKNFSVQPVGRYPQDSPVSGTKFRDEILYPALKGHDQVDVFIDGVHGYSVAFLDEAFGGLIRKGYFTYDELIGKLSIRYADNNFEIFADIIDNCIKEAKVEN